MGKPAICQIVPTKDNPDLLRRLFESLRGQENALHQLVVVDGGTEQRVDDLCLEYDWLPITYEHISPPGLARQRNRGLEMVAGMCTLVGFWDDDLVILPGSVDAMREFWAQAGGRVGGAEYNIVDGMGLYTPSVGLRKALDRFFHMNPMPPGSLARSGHVTTPFPAESTKQVRWLCGGANLYRKEIFERHSFDEWYNGYGIGDDVDFSMSLGEDWELYVVSTAPIRHLATVRSRQRQFMLGKIMTTNRLHLVNKYASYFRRGDAFWCTVGVACRRILGGIRHMDWPDVAFGLGALSVLPSFLLRRLQPIERQVK